MLKAHKLLVFGLLALFFVVFCSENLSAQKSNEKTFNVDFSNTLASEVLHYIQSNSEVKFSYSPSLINLDYTLTFKKNNVTIFEILDAIFENKDIAYQFYGNIVVLKKKPQNLNKILISGFIYDSKTQKPLEYVAVQQQTTQNGAITRTDGSFKLLINKDELNDTLLISSLGYKKQRFQARVFGPNIQRTIFVEPTSIELEQVDVNLKDYKFLNLGNKFGIAMGSIYIDTHGQQTALFIENKKSKEGKIVAVRYYLSNKGNIDAPFRVRIYERDSNGFAPANELTTEVIIAKPNFDGGWFTVDLSQYDINVPEDGFFVAIQGIHPNDLRKKDGFTDVSKRKSGLRISYGQRLAYSRKKGKQTWHYSLTNTWFQLEKNNYNVMIKAEVQYRKKKKR